MLLAVSSGVVRERDVIEAAAQHALSVHRNPDSPPLTAYGLAMCAASLALVLTDPNHPNHVVACARHGIPEREL